MWHRIADSPARISVIIAAALTIATTIFVLMTYAAATNSDLPLIKRLAGGLLFDFWLVLPYLAVAALAVWLAPARSASFTVLVGSMLIAAWPIWVVNAISRKPNDGQNGLALAMLPLFQWLTVFLVGIAALVIRRWRDF